MKKVLVIYHREDVDGVCSAAIVKSFLMNTCAMGQHYQPADFEMYGVNYADLSRDWKEFTEWCSEPTEKKPRMAKWDKFEWVFMLDISFNDMEAMLHMRQAFGNRFHWCDHHAPIIEATKDTSMEDCQGVRLTSQSALANTWMYLNRLIGDRMGGIPDELEMLSDYDSWTWTYKHRYSFEDAREELFAYNTGVTRRSNLKVAWFVDWLDRLWHSTYDDFRTVFLDAMDYGMIVYALDKERTERAIKNHGDTGWVIGENEQDEKDRKACCIVTTDRFNSLSFASFKGTEVTNGIVFKIDAKNNMVVMSLYNVDADDTFDCGKFCKDYYGGGGHHGAAGATITMEQFTNMLISKYI
jgi:oligoribonuclease NrnB/cAMP/cGMP phosphodiesterase (DHH superfamily)